jgi:hypothetical protein
MKDSFIILSPNNLTSSYNNNSNYSPDRNNLYQQQQQPRNTFKSNNQVLAAPAAAAQQQQQQQQRQMSANNTGGSTSQRYKTELCRPFMEYNHCKYDDKCQFAHGINELRNLSRHPKYKTELCKTFHSHGLCPYGHRCHFIHNNQNSGSPPGLNTNNNINSNHGNSNSGGVATNPALILSEIGQNNHHHLKHNNSGNNWSINYYNTYEDNSKAIGTSSSLSSDENLSLCSSPTSSDSSSSGSGPGTFSIVPFDIVGQKGFTEQMQHPHHHQYQEPESEHVLNMGQLDQHNNITLEQFNNSRLPIFSSMILRK